MSAMVEIRSVRKSFGSHEVLRGIDLEVRTGEVTVVLGPSGSGKSTLLRTVNHLEKVDSGRITVDGRLVGYRRSGDKLYELREREVLRRRTQIGFVFQNFHLFPHLTVLENITEAPISALKRPVPRPSPPPTPCWSASASPRRPVPTPATSPAGSSSASPSPARSPSNPSCSSSTSPPPPSTRNWSARSSTSSRTWPGRAPP